MIDYNISAIVIIGIIAVIIHLANKYLKNRQKLWDIEIKKWNERFDVTKDQEQK